MDRRAAQLPIPRRAGIGSSSRGCSIVAIVVCHLDGLDGSEEAVTFVVETRREVQRVRARGERSPELEPPQAVDGEGLATLVVKLPEKIPVGAEGADAPVAEIADEDVTAES